MRGVLIVTALFLSMTACRGTKATPDPSPSAASSLGAASRPAFNPEPTTLDEATLARLNVRLSHHRVLPTPAFEVVSPVGLKPATIFFAVIPEKRIGAFTVPVLGVVSGNAAPEVVDLVPYERGNLVHVDAFEVVPATGKANDGYHSAPSPAGPGNEILLLSTFSAEGAPTRFKKGHHLLWTPSGHLVESLASHAIRDVTTLTDIPSLRRALSDARKGDDCPDPEPGMERPILALVFQCMIEHDRREQIARSVAYPIEVLLASGDVRKLETPNDLLAVYDDVIHRRAREGVREVAGNPGAVYEWQAYDAFRLGYAGLLVQDTPYLIGGKRVPPRIIAVFNDDPLVHEKMRGKLAGLFRSAKSDVLCRTDKATHVFSEGAHGLGRLATWNDPKADYRSRPPSRVLFGLLASAGTAGNQFYEFIGPDGASVKLEHLVTYGPGPGWEYQVRSDSGDEPCKNHQEYKVH